MDRIEMCGETPEARRIRELDKEIDTLRNVIVDQAKELLQVKTKYQEMSQYNQQLEDSRRRSIHEAYIKTVKETKIKQLLKHAKKDAEDISNGPKQREASKIRIEALQDALDILTETDE